METDPLTTLDEFGSRRFVIPAEARGLWRRRRTIVYYVLIVFFLVLPWIKINRVQALLIDLPNRRFAILGQIFYAHDGPFVFLILAGAVLSLAAATAVWGRIWCGWACPQTVFIDAVYRQIEIWVEGDYIKRRRLHSGPMTFEKFRKSGLKWFLYFAVSSIIAHSFIALFAGSDELIAMMQKSPNENWTYFVIVTFTTVLLVFNFGWFREQFCTIMCPYGRFQSVLMDQDSLAILYDEKRGEPRKGTPPPEAKRGDCVSCNRCVEVCPAKIDIRRGLQMECIACTACIDACDEIMAKVHKPAGLIRYQSVRGQGVRYSSPRALIYGAGALLCAVLLVAGFINHPAYHLIVLRAKDTPYQTLPENQVLNHFKVHLFNQSPKTQEFTFGFAPDLTGQGAKVTQVNPVTILHPGQSAEVHLFVTFPAGLLKADGETELPLLVNEKTLGESPWVLRVVGPMKASL